MKKKWIAAALVLMVESSSLSALFVQNPADPCAFDCQEHFYTRINCMKICQFGFGFYSDIVFNRYLKIREVHKALYDTEIETFAGMFVINLCNRLDCFATFGQSKLTICTDLDTYQRSSELAPNVMTKLQFSNAFSWSAGVRGCAWRCRGWVIGVETQYERFHPKYQSFGDTNSTTNLSNWQDAFYEDWQLGLAVTTPVCVAGPEVRVYPYLGAKMGWARLFQNHTPFLALPGSYDLEDFVFPDCKASKLWGFVLGMSVNVKKCAAICCEGRFGDEKAFSTTAQFRY